MTTGSAPRRNLESFKKEAKRWLAGLRAGDAAARERFVRQLGPPAGEPVLRDVQLALAREHGFEGWAQLRAAAERAGSVPPLALAAYHERVAALLEAYRTGTPDAMERHYRLTWHRRVWPAMRTYVQLDLGKRPAAPDDPVDITEDDARYLIAIEHGFENWDALEQSVADGTRANLAKPVRIHAGDAKVAQATRDWEHALEVLRATPGAVLEAHGQVTDDMLRDLARIETLAGLDAGGSEAVTDAGLAHLATLPELRDVNLSGTSITDGALPALAQLGLERLSLSMTRVTDAGIASLGACARLRDVDLSWTATGDAALKALSGLPALTVLRTGNDVTDAGVRLLHGVPSFKSWGGGEIRLGLLVEPVLPNQLHLRGRFTDEGMRALQGLDGLAALSVDPRGPGLTAAAPLALTTLPNLAWLSVDATADWMPHIANLPALRFLSSQDTTADDDGFEALSRSRTIEYIWGRRCHNLRRRGFHALSTMPALRGLSVSCLNVDDEGLSALPRFPVLRELMPMDVPDAGYRHVAACTELTALLLMYCRDTTDAATEQIARLPRLTRYFNSYTTITDRTPELLSGMDTLERVTFDACHLLTDAGVASLARLPRLRELRVSGRGPTAGVVRLFPKRIAVYREP